MRTTLIFLLLALAIFQTRSQTAKPFWTAGQCIQMKNISSVRVSPDGKKVVYAVREASMKDDKSEYINQLFVCNADGSHPYPLTQGDKNNSSPRWSPDGRQVAFISNRDGKTNLYLIHPDGGEAQKLTDAKTGINNFDWSPDGKMIAYTMTDPSPEDREKKKKDKNDWYYYDDEVLQSRLYVLWLGEKDSTGNNKSSRLTKEDRNVTSFDWSPDSKWIAYTHSKTPLVNDIQYSDISKVNVASGETKIVANTPAGELDPNFSPDGKYIAYLTTENPLVWAGKSWVVLVPTDGGSVKNLPSTPNEQPSIIGWSHDGNSLYLVEANKTLLSVYQLQTNGTLTEWNKGQHDLQTGFTMNRSADMFGFVQQNPEQPGEAFVSPISNCTPVKISNINPDLAGHPLPRTTLIQWKSFDGKTIEGLLTYPLHYEAGKKYPLILNPHGGPAGGYAQSCIASNQSVYPLASLAEEGFFILRPNPRGSTGYGTEFREANFRDWGGADYKDLMAGVDYVIGEGLADSSKLGVMGWSYGGFMSSWIVGHTDRFKAASIGAPVVDLSYQNLTDDIPNFLPSYMQSDPWADWAVYDQHSPLRYVQNVKTPVMLQHGEADARVPIGNSLMFYHALKRRGIPVRLLALPRQPHGPTEPKMVLQVMQSNTEWFARHLLPDEKKGF